MAKKTKFEAAASANGYLYQCEYALWLAIATSDEDPTYRIAIESLDDVIIRREKGPTDLVQVKYRIRSPGNLTNASPDLWKTIRIWSEALKQHLIQLPGTSLFLVTTQVCSPNTIAGWLVPQGKGTRNTHKAIAELRRVAKKSKSGTNESAYASFRSLTLVQQDMLINAIEILDRSPQAGDLGRRIENLLVRAVERQNVKAFKDRLMGWWIALVSEALDHTDRRMISSEQLEDKIAELREEFRRDNLPVDFLYYQATSKELSEKHKLFVEQLRLILLDDKTLEYAIRDYYAAFHQRSKWLREGLIIPDELTRYEQRLVEEWERYFSLQKARLSLQATEQDAIATGLDVYEWVTVHNDIRLRPLLEAAYVRRGSYHMLADIPKVGWHPAFLDRLEALLHAR